jgi:hypothetical protein
MMPDSTPSRKRNWLFPVDEPFVLPEEEMPGGWEEEGYEDEDEDDKPVDIQVLKDELERAIREGDEEWYIENRRSSIELIERIEKTLEPFRKCFKDNRISQKSNQG